MENLQDELTQLLNKTEWSHHEKEWLLKYLEGSDTEQLRKLLEHQFEVGKDEGKQLPDDVTSQMLQNIHERIGAVKRINKASIVKMWTLRIAVASLMGFLVLSTYTWLTKERKGEIVKIEENSKPQTSSIDPGGNKAILTLADGSSIVLEENENGLVTRQGNTKVIKIDGKLVYNSAGANNNEVFYNTITTPVGGQYQIELPDGSRIWLNSGSSIRFPTAFVGKERRVEIKGEAYFEVEKNAEMPFRVKVNDAEVEVMGTSFNVMAYGDEAALKTTLLEGKVKFTSGQLHSILKPGQQTQLTKDGRLKVISEVNTDEVVAWKNGMFDFEGADIESLTRQLSRWYDVEMVFDKKIDDHFYAEIPRNTKLQDVLKALELTGKVRFAIKGRKIIVTAH